MATYKNWVGLMGKEVTSNIYKLYIFIYLNFTIIVIKADVKGPGYVLIGITTKPKTCFGVFISHYPTNKVSKGRT